MNHRRFFRGSLRRLVAGVMIALGMALLPASPAPQSAALSGAAAGPPGQVSPAPGAGPAGEGILTRDRAVELALQQASGFQQAQYAEQIAAEDVRQARSAFLPRVEGSFAATYNTPARESVPPGTPKDVSFIAADALRQYQAVAGVAGDLDVAGKLRATLRRNTALREAARAGTAIARSDLVQAVDEAYCGLALATAQRLAAEQGLAAAEDFERITRLLLDGGEVPAVDVTRARLLALARRDGLERAKAAEEAAAMALRMLIGYDFNAKLNITDLSAQPADGAELEHFTADAIGRRPEFARYEAERTAAEQEKKIARAERLPQFSYFFQGGFDSDSLQSSSLKTHTGLLAGLSITVPLYDWGASRSRERQADLRARTARSERDVALRTFAQQFYTARGQALSAVARAKVLREGVAGAEKVLATSLARYQAGETPILDVTEAQTALSDQRAALSQALYDFWVARARLAQLTMQ